MTANRAQQPTGGPPLPRSAHPSEVETAHQRALAGSSGWSRRLEMASGQRIHLLEAGDGEPLVLLHGSGPSALLFLPLITRLNGVRAIAVDRPGFGLSDPTESVSPSYRDAAVAWVASVIDGLGLEQTALLGNSTGGMWAIWYALAHPERVRRLVILGAPPLLSSTRVPPPMLAVAAPDTGGPPPQMPTPSPETVARNMSVFGEGDTIVSYPDLIDALVAAANDPIASGASLGELRTIISPAGWQPELETPPSELEGLTMPTLLIWGDGDPLGGSEVAGTTAASIPEARLEVLAAGHAPWLGHPDRAATLVSEFVR